MDVYGDGSNGASSGTEAAADQGLSLLIDDVDAGQASEADLAHADSAMDAAAVPADHGPFWDADLSRYTLQPVMIRSEAEALAPHIFYKVLGGHVTPAASGIRLNAGTKIGFNNYVNSFYAAYWLKHTDIRAISLSGMLYGHGVLHLFKSMPSGGTMRVGSYLVGLKDKRAPFHVHFDLYGFFPSDDGPGRYFFDLEAVSDMEVEKISFTSFVPPAREANFSISVHAHRDDERVTNLVMTLEKYMRVRPHLLSGVSIYRSSDNESDISVISDLCADDRRFNIVEASQLDGATEFSDALNKSVENESSSHHIFLDDNSFLDPYILDRMRAFCSYASEEFIVGGHILDMKRPNIVQDAGTKLDDWGTPQKVGRELDASSHLDVAFYDRVRDVDYGSLGFACLPKAVVARTGIPSTLLMPDDGFAYAHSADMPSELKIASLPGIFIWREAASVRQAYALQELLLPDMASSDPLSADLYLRQEGAAQGILNDPVFLAAPHRGIPLPLGGVVSFDSYLNTFYESYWQEAAALQTVCLEVEIFGRVRMHVLRHAPLGGVRSVVQVEFGVEGMATRHVVEVPNPLLAAERFKLALGRIWCGFEGWSQDARFISGRWATWDEPKQQRRVAVVMCTFNKPKDVIRNLDLARSIFRQESALARFILVDQGSKKVSEDPEFAAVASGEGWTEQLKIVTQGNLGGAGGFTRGMIEGFADPSITDVLLLDDDIVLEPRVLQRLAVLLQHLKKPHMIGGQMFDLFYRGVMHAHAERANFDNLSYEPITPHGVDMTNRGANDLFLETVVGNYNGWWTCCIPREAVEAVGLPLPFFVRCDDSEFGSRLSAAKFPMITFPGIFVWHEPFYSKISGWMMYYEFRNFLVMATLRKGAGGKSRQRAYYKKFINYISTNLFDHALALNVALEHYLEGPDFIFENTETIHSDIVKLLAQHQPPSRKGGRSLARPDIPRHLPEKISERAKNRAILMWAYGWKKKPKGSHVDQAEIGELHHFNRDFVYGREELDIYNRYSGDIYSLKRDPEFARALTWRLFKNIRRWKSAKHDLADAYQDALSKRSTLENWCSYLKLDLEEYRAVTLSHEQEK